MKPFRPGNVLVIHIGRCGSTVLEKLLNQHRMIYWGSELYEPIFGTWKDNNNGKELKGEMPEDAIDILKNNYWQALHRYYGFEMKPYHFNLIGHDPTSFIDRIERLGFSHFIILDRKNRLRKIISSEIAHKKGGYHTSIDKSQSRKSTTIDINKIEIDFDSKSLLQFLHDYDTSFALMKKVLSDKKVLHLTYEDDISNDPKNAYRKVCKFLNIKAQDVSITLKKTNPYPIRDLVENFEEVSETLTGTKYEWMLELDS